MVSLSFRPAISPKRWMISQMIFGVIRFPRLFKNNAFSFEGWVLRCSSISMDAYSENEIICWCHLFLVTLAVHLIKLISSIFKLQTSALPHPVESNNSTIALSRIERLAL